ncbi:TPA: SAM-dependent DNA methyltransferase [Vibrio parahaemolyticus]|nr:SAM-dependent DNA methyltransferase [Vibrio parahaemolyticus]HCE2048861.1 SAM-dependent DNA methyltransferase [Vibrio parahaemolyticus]
MRQALDKTLRKKLEDTVVKARDIVEQAVFEALQRLGVAEAQAPSYLNEEERALRNKLRAHARQLGDKLKDGKQETERLINEMAYEHWHRMLFARYLEQNNLLMYDEYTPVTLDECFELAEEEPDCKDGWELAGRLAQKMLPQIFRVDSPVFDIKLSMNRVEELESLIAQLDPQTYQAQDSLGWCYQFWQTKKKDQVNKSGVKIGAQELSPVTQLFTEPYMVSFLLDNVLGAWWANKRLSQDDLIRANNEQELRELAAIPGVSLEYLRFSKEEDTEQWKPAAGGFEKWPENLSELKTLDPCCGSGHFLVAVFLMLVPMRMQLEGLSEKQAVDAVLRDNIHGLELDQRCVELAAFALALEAWRYPNAGGYRVLPELQLACSGMSIAEAQKEWKDLAKGDEALTDAIAWMQHTFKDAPTLGSLIEPKKVLENGQTPPWELLQNALEAKLDVSSEAKIVAQGMAKSADILAEKFHLVATNVPYLATRKQDKVLVDFLAQHYFVERFDLASALISRCLEFCTDSGVVLEVSPQAWNYLGSYADFRIKLLTNSNLELLARLGTGAFESISGQVVNVCLAIHANHFCTQNQYAALNVSNSTGAVAKAAKLHSEMVNVLMQDEQLNNPDSAILTEFSEAFSLLSNHSKALAGILNGDAPRFRFKHWEVIDFGHHKWAALQENSPTSEMFTGRSSVLLWENETGSLHEYAELARDRLHDAHRRGNEAWFKKGIAVSRMGKINTTLYQGNLFDQNVAVILPRSPEELSAIWTYCSSDKYEEDLRVVNPSLAISSATVAKVSFDFDHWLGIANKTYPNGLPKPYSNDLTQWIFHGHPCASVIWDEESKTTAVAKLREDDTVLQVAVARLLGYQWPAELDPEMELAPEMREVMKKNADFAGLIDDDGIVCIPAVRGEKTAAKRLEAILHKAYGDEWTSSVEQNLLKVVKAKDLESWLRDKFFDQHCKLFQHRPFIWQVWDGLKDGFSALVNYHKLDYKGLERLIYTYLDDWISTQKRDIADGKDGADIRLTAAENLKKQLEAILAGEKGLDIFVRWKPLEDQPIGWNPDLNDGVRLNIRPFMLAKDVGKKGAGVLRGKPNIHWKKDRGTDVASAPWFDLGPVYGEKEGSRINDHHLTLAEKKAAREQAND